MEFNDMQEVIHNKANLLQNKVNFMLKSSLKSLKKHFYVIKRLSGGRKSTIQQHGVRCHTSNSLPIISMKVSRIMSERKIGLLIFVTSIQLIMQFAR